MERRRQGGRRRVKVPGKNLTNTAPVTHKAERLQGAMAISCGQKTQNIARGSIDANPSTHLAAKSRQQGNSYVPSNRRETTTPTTNDHSGSPFQKGCRECLGWRSPHGGTISLDRKASISAHWRRCRRQPALAAVRNPGRCHCRRNAGGRKPQQNLSFAKAFGDLIYLRDGKRI